MTLNRIPAAPRAARRHLVRPGSAPVDSAALAARATLSAQFRADAAGKTAQTGKIVAALAVRATSSTYFRADAASKSKNSEKLSKRKNRWKRINLHVFSEKYLLLKKRLLEIYPKKSNLPDMKENYHLCFTSHSEVMFRDGEDHGMFLNLLALRSYADGTEYLADAEMSTHVHLDAFTDCPMKNASLLRMSYTKYFNHRWGRRGRMGEKYTYIQKVSGFNHRMVLDNYILRNGLHHCAAATPWGYEFCSVRELFPRDLGFAEEPFADMSRNEIAGFLPRYAKFPDEFRMNRHGFFERRSFMEFRRVEQLYATPRNFLYQMNRLTDESWVREQAKDNTGKPLTLNDIERADEKSVATMLSNEYGRNFRPDKLQDMDVCRLIDKDMLPSFGATSVYQLTPSQKQRIARTLKYDFRLPESQICRCLVY